MPPDARRQQLLAAARLVFAARGYHGATVGQVCTEAKVARGTFYNYFDSKRAVFRAVLAQMMDEILIVVVPIDVQHPITPQVRANIERVIHTIMAHGVARVLFSEAVGIDEDGDEALRGFYFAILEVVERALRTGQGLGVVRPGNVRLRARCLLGMLKEPVFQASLDGETLDHQVLVDEMMQLVEFGVLG